VIHIEVPEFKYDYFDPTKINPTVGRFCFHRSEITPMIHDYLDYHTTRPGVSEIVTLLYQLHQFLLTTDENYYFKLSDEQYHSYENEMSNALDHAIAISHSKDLGFNDQNFLQSAIRYALSCIVSQTEQLNKIDSQKVQSRRNHFKLEKKDLTQF
jgi:hypothetical protein